MTTDQQQVNDVFPTVVGVDFASYLPLLHSVDRRSRRAMCRWQAHTASRLRSISLLLLAAQSPSVRFAFSYCTALSSKMDGERFGEIRYRLVQGLIRALVLGSKGDVSLRE